MRSFLETMKNVMIIFMGAYVFNNEIFDSWLNKKSEEILSKVDRERITTEEMIILVLKAQTNHFHHMDVDMMSGLDDVRKEMKSGLDDVRKEMKSGLDDVRNEMKSGLDDVRKEMKSGLDDVRKEMKNGFDGVNNKFDQINLKFESND